MQFIGNRIGVSPPTASPTRKNTFLDQYTSKITTLTPVTSTYFNLLQPYSVRQDTSGNIYISDCTCNSVFKVNTNNIITLFAGRNSSSLFTYNGDNILASTAGIFNHLIYG